MHNVDELGHVSQNDGHSTAKPRAHNPLSVMFPQLNLLLVSMVQLTCGLVVLITFDTAAVKRIVYVCKCLLDLIILGSYLGLEILAESKHVQLVLGCSTLYPIAGSDTPPLVLVLWWIRPPVVRLHQGNQLKIIIDSYH